MITMDAQEAFDELVYYFLGDDYYKSFDWLNNITGNAVAIRDIKREYPKNVTRIIRKISHFIRKHKRKRDV